MKGYPILTELQRVVPDWPNLTFTSTNHLPKYMRWFDIPIPYVEEKHWSDNTKARWMTAALFPICKFCDGSIFLSINLIRSRKGNIADSLLTSSSTSVLRKAKKIAKRRWGFCAWYLITEFHSKIRMVSIIADFYQLPTQTGLGRSLSSYLWVRSLVPSIS